VVLDLLRVVDREDRRLVPLGCLGGLDDILDRRLAGVEGIKILTCKGTASWSDGTTGKVNYYLSADRDYDEFIGYRGD